MRTRFHTWPFRVQFFKFVQNRETHLDAVPNMVISFSIKAIDEVEFGRGSKDGRFVFKFSNVEKQKMNLDAVPNMAVSFSIFRKYEMLQAKKATFCKGMFSGFVGNGERYHFSQCPFPFLPIFISFILNSICLVQFDSI